MMPFYGFETEKIRTNKPVLTNTLDKSFESIIVDSHLEFLSCKDTEVELI